MRTVLIFTLVFVAAVCGQTANAQMIKLEPKLDVNLNIQDLQSQKNKVRAKEKDMLKEEVEKIEQKLKDGKISEAKAEELKKAAAEKHAKNIEDQLDIIDANIALLKRNKGKGEDSDYYKEMQYLNVRADTVEEHTKPTRTHSSLVISFGLSNAIGDGQSLDDSPYKIGGSRFFEIGWEFSTVLIKSGFLRVNYGLQFQFNGLKPTDDRYFVDNGDQTVIEPFPYDLKKAKLRLDNLVIPVHFEIGPTDDNYYAENFRLGLGGYLGLNLNTMQKLKYQIDGRRTKQKVSGSYNTNNFIYGLSAYIGYDDIALYVKYDLNPIFKDNPIEEHMVAIGLRFVL